MTTTLPNPSEDSNKSSRILKWSKFFDSSAPTTLSLPQQLELRRYILDIEKVYGQGEDLMTSEVGRQVVKDLLDFHTEVMTAMFTLHKRQLEELKKIVAPIVMAPFEGQDTGE